MKSCLTQQLQIHFLSLASAIVAHSGHLIFTFQKDTQILLLRDDGGSAFSMP